MKFIVIFTLKKGKEPGIMPLNCWEEASEVFILMSLKFLETSNQSSETFKYNIKLSFKVFVTLKQTD